MALDWYTAFFASRDSLFRVSDKLQWSLERPYAVLHIYTWSCTLVLVVRESPTTRFGVMVEPPHDRAGGARESNTPRHRGRI